MFSIILFSERGMEMKTTALFTGLVKVGSKIVRGIIFPFAIISLVVALAFPEKGEEPREGEEDLL